MAPFVKFMLYTLVRHLGLKLSLSFALLMIEMQGVIAWPVAKLLEFTLGAHHGIIYRRSGECLSR